MTEPRYIITCPMCDTEVETRIGMSGVESCECPNCEHWILAEDEGNPRLVEGE